MAKRGRPPHPDILTPREWEVLGLLREGLSNEQLARRLEITERTAKWHVAEILSKLGVGSREEAAAWQPEGRRWPLAAFAPLLFWRKLGWGWLLATAGGVAIVAVAAGLGLLAWGILRTEESGPEQTSLPAGVTPEPPDELRWERNGDVWMRSEDPGTCGDAQTARSFGVPMMLEIPDSNALFDRGRTVLLGLEADPYEYIPEQVAGNLNAAYEVRPDGWEVTFRRMQAFGAHPNRFSANEYFLRRMDMPSLLFRYSVDLCDQEDGSPSQEFNILGGSSTVQIGKVPEVVGNVSGKSSSYTEVIDLVENEIAPSMTVLRVEHFSGNQWSVLVAGDGMGPARPEHMWGYRLTIDTESERYVSQTCYFDFHLNE